MEEMSNLPARFFKVILPSTTTQQRLRIPNKFVEEYGDELSSFVTLTNPIDGTWCARLEKAEKTFWLQDGWEKFFDDHSIDYGYFLLFKYTGNSNFNVHIFDLTATEVDYHNNRNFRKDENSDDDSVKILTSFPSKPDISSTRNGLENERGIHATYGIRHGVEGGNRDAADQTPKSHRSYITRSKCKIEGGRLEIKTENLNTSRKFSPKNPSFGVSLKPYNLFPRCCMYVPAAFSRHIPRASGHFELHDSDGKKWLLSMIQRKRCNYLCKGWKTDIKEKNLKVGDICVFELIDVNKCMLKVFTFGNTVKIPDGVQQA